MLHRVLHPLGYHMQVASENFLGTNHIRAIEEEVSKKVDAYGVMIQQSAEECEGEGVDIEVKITVGTPVRTVIVQEVATLNANWVILDRHLRREWRFYLKYIACKVALVLDNLSVEVLRSDYSDQDFDDFEAKLFYSPSKPIELPSAQDNDNNEQTSMSINYNTSMGSLESSDMAKSNSFTSNFKQYSFSSQDEFGSNLKPHESGSYAKCENQYTVTSPIIQKQQGKPSRQRSSDVPILCISCEITMELYLKRYSYSEIQLATNDFLPDNLLGEGRYGHVYKGRLKDGQLIATKVRKEASRQGFSEFHSEVYVLSFARHKNIVMLLGYFCSKNLNILVYEYICNKSLEWHLFENTDCVLEWHRRHAIAIGTAKGLRFLHEECRGNPIIHRDIRPSNILLTHEYVPMLGHFGLAKWKTNEEDIQTRVLARVSFQINLAPEYAENGIVSVRTDVYSFGIVLIQLISGRKAVDSTREDQQSVRLWTLALHELVDPRLDNLYNTYELYHMARTAFLCVQTEPEMRPSMAEVLHLLEGESEHFHHLTEQFIPHYGK
ncbi:receptor-like cytosolic serine threonine- kinase RBK1 [Olea europaea subsp. europaea]|uniref:Receptor-like cytosolic serine threonine- kinase RBK1 n=1 Tax=Olea europaea subsp. europaea TaxID=158383 RepID=A0A8S0PQT4_OLEEU|nr:receptor-like cytosolic serine threonine- kinase RBK1 [Olea europaea subsp. europaea]